MNEPTTQNDSLPQPLTQTDATLTATNAINPTPAPQPPGEASWESVRRWTDWAAKFGRGSLACQVMAGFGLLGLRDTYDIKNGRPSHDKKLSHNEKVSWNNLVSNELHISSATTYRWMKMAKALRDQYGDLTAPDRLRALLGTSPKDWTTDDSELVVALVDQVTDGKTALAFLRELGVTRRPARPQRQAHPKPDKTLPTDQQIETAKTRWDKLRRELRQYGRAFEILDELDVSAQIVILTTATHARQNWLDRQNLISSKPVLSSASQLRESPDPTPIQPRHSP